VDIQEATLPCSILMEMVSCNSNVFSFPLYLSRVTITYSHVILDLQIAKFYTLLGFSLFAPTMCYSYSLLFLLSDEDS
jgi:hypothetical protein